MKKQLIILFLSILALAPVNAEAVKPQIMGRMDIIKSNIIVNLNINNVTELESLIKSGIEKEIIFTVELLRVWKYWPDEFVVSKHISKVIKYDSLRERYRALYDDGINRSEIYFEDYTSLRKWIFTVNNINLANVKELETGNYYIRIIVESRSLEQLPLLGFLMHFIPEVEMSLAKESQPFKIGDRQ
jgi:hypothetical protein